MHPDLEIVSGLAKGPDTFGKDWADENGVYCHEYPANWDDLKVPGAVIKYNRSNKPYNAVAGHQRNAAMSDIATAVLVFWDGASTGTKNMIQRARKKELPVAIVRY